MPGRFCIHSFLSVPRVLLIETAQKSEPTRRRWTYRNGKWEMGVGAMTSCVVLGLFCYYRMLEYSTNSLPRPGELGQPLSLQNFSSLQIRKAIGLEQCHHGCNNVSGLSSTCHIQPQRNFFIRSFVHHWSTHSNQERAFSPRFMNSGEFVPPHGSSLVLISNRLYLARPRSSFRCTQSTRDIFFQCSHPRSLHTFVLTATGKELYDI